LDAGRGGEIDLVEDSGGGHLGLKQVLMSEGTNAQPNNILGVSGLAACNDAGVALVERVTGLRAFNMKDPDSVDNLRVLLEKRLLLKASCAV
jgi:hypothetical protein